MMQPPNDEREVLVQYREFRHGRGEYKPTPPNKITKMDVARFRSGNYEIDLGPGFSTGKLVSTRDVVAWCELPAAIEQGARLVPVTPEIAEAIIGAVWACEQNESGITPDDAEKVRTLFAPLDKHA